jgi:hypothetical protein
MTTNLVDTIRKGLRDWETPENRYAAHAALDALEAQLPLAQMPVEISLADDDPRTVKIYWREVKDGKLMLWIGVKDATTAAQQHNPVAASADPSGDGLGAVDVSDEQETVQARYLWTWPNGKQEIRDYSEARSFSDWPAEVAPLTTGSDK